MIQGLVRGDGEQTIPSRQELDYNIHSSQRIYLVNRTYIPMKGISLSVYT
jgi:hypothetical protein